MESFSMRLLPLFDWLLWTTIQAALLFCLIMLVQFILRSRLPISWHYCLWLLLLIRLVMPWLPESRISIFNLVPRSVQQGRILESYSKSQSVHGMDLYFSAKSTNSQELENNSEAISVRFVRMLPLLWLLGIVVLGVYVGAGNFHLWWLVTRERPLTNQKILDLLEDCKSEMGIRTILGVVMTDKVKSPALFGFLRPRLLLPAGMIETLSREELRYVFLHELGHLRRHDIYVGWLMSLFQVLHWFNPLVWLAFYRMQTDRELACDALVLNRTRNDESKDYGRTIVNLLEHFSRPQRLPSMAGILETKSQLKRRIKMIAKFKKTSRPRWAGAMLLLAALGCIVLTNAYVAKADFTFGTPTNLGSTLNNEWGAYSPCISTDGLELYYSGYYASANEYGQVDLWVVRRESINDQWGHPENLGPNVNSGMPEHAPSITADRLLLFFMRYDELWQTNRESPTDPWDPAVRVGSPIDIAGAVDGPASVSPDGLSLFFLSDRSGGGDIYVATRETRYDEWSEPTKLGLQVNSSDYQEGWMLCISVDGLSLFFGSGLYGKPRPGGLGKCDIWVTTRRTTSDDWDTPLNLGSPVNSPYDESGVSISGDGSTLYFTSDRPGGFGRSDIWQVSILPVVDLNGDGKVDLKDLRKLAQYWGQDEPSCDIAPLPNGDGIVDEQDLNLLAEHLMKELQPVAHWKLDEVEGIIAEDSIGNNDGTIQGNPVWQPAGGAVGGALQLDGVDDYISTAFGLDPTKGSFSAFAWIKGGAPGQVIICQTGSSDMETRWLWADPSYGRLMTWLMHPTYGPLVSESIITDGQWHHVGLVYDLERFRRLLYVDGVEVAKDNSLVVGEPSDGGLYFGADNRLGQGTFFSGLIDDIRIYDEVLSAEEVADLVR